MASVRDAILLGGLLAVIVLLVFLRDWRLTLVASVTLPLTVLATFVLMQLFGESINLMSMGGLAVAIGLVIDDAVVVVENIHRRASRQARRRVVEAAIGELIGAASSAPRSRRWSCSCRSGCSRASSASSSARSR